MWKPNEQKENYNNTKTTSGGEPDIHIWAQLLIVFMYVRTLSKVEWLPNFLRC